jgi:hypothetical protein
LGSGVIDIPYHTNLKQCAMRDQGFSNDEVKPLLCVGGSFSDTSALAFFIQSLKGLVRYPICDACPYFLLLFLVVIDNSHHFERPSYRNASGNM